MNRYIQTLAIMLAALMAVGTAKAQAQAQSAGVHIHGSVYGGGNNADVQTNTAVNIGAGQVDGNVYGGGNVGDVGTINKTNIRAYKWTNDTNPGDTYNYNNTGSCTVTINGGTIGLESTNEPTKHGNVFGAGRGLDDTFWCEKAMVYKTTVSITGGTVYGNVYGGGQIGRVETNTTVTIGKAGETVEGSKPAIIGNVFGAGAGLKTHGYSALVRGNTEVTVQGVAKVGKSVYGGGEIATVGKYNLVQKGDMDTEEHRAAFFAAHPGVDPLIEVGMPYSITSDNLGICTVTVKDKAVIGQSGSGDVFGAGKGVIPAYAADDPSTTDVDERSKRMASYDSELYPEGGSWEYSDGTHLYVWEYFDKEPKYLTFVQTLALATQTSVTVGGSAQVNGSVYGGSESGYVQHHTQVTVQETCNIGTNSVTGNVFGGGRGISGNATAGRASGNTTVNILGGTTYGDVYGGGEKGPVGTSSTTTTSTTENETTITTTTYPTATVNLLGGTITGDAYGGGLGDASTAADAGNTQVNLNGMATNEYTAAFADYLVALNTSPSDDDTTNDYYMVKTNRAGCKVNRIFGANNTNGTPKGNVTVHVYATQSKIAENNTIAKKSEINTNIYDLSAVYGGGNEAAYDPVTPYENGTGSKSQVFIEGCAYTSIETVYGGGNAAAVPETNVRIVSDHEIGTVFGGGNGKDNKSDGSDNPGADIGTKDQGSSKYGTGNANTLITGGYVHEAYGGSNERGTIMGSVNLDASADGICEMVVKKMVGAGKNADIMGDAIVTLGCMPETWVDEYYGGADNANVHGNVELTITSGNFRKVFGGNNQGGIIMGHIKVNIEETGCRPINIDELYLGGNMAAYSAYGYYVMKDGAGAPVLNGGKLAFYPRESATDTHPAVKPFFAGATYEEYTEAGNDVFTPYAQPELNIISCTRIGKVFGGGLGETAKMYADPTVNINQIYGTPGGVVSTTLGAIGGDYTDAEGDTQQGGIFGGGNAANVYGNTTVNIGNLTEVDPVSTLTGLSKNGNDKYDVVGANIVGNVYGGGNEADVTGNTFVHVCANKSDETDSEYQAVSDGSVGVHITGNVFGGGKGKADTFTCEKAMVGKEGDGIDHPDGGTTVIIGNGTIDGSVYGGGEIGRVEKNTVVTIGLGEGVATEGTATSAPVVTGNVFGAGKGLETHGYAALVRGNPTVTIQGNAKVLKSVYGGGEIASVARYDVVNGVPVALAQVKEGQHSGWCTVNVKGYAEIGPETAMKMYHEGKAEADDAPDDAGHVFAAGKGVLPENYTYANNANRPRRMMAFDETKYTASNQEYWEYSDDSHENVWEYFPNETKYFEFIQTLALATQTSATIGGNALVKGSVYGGSENGLVQYDTNVTIEGDCQIGCGKNTTGRHPDPVWDDDYTVPDDGTDLECASWEYDGKTGAPYDPYAIYKKDGKYYYDEACTNYADGGAKIAKDGHTYYGNVFGGGSGSVPYFDTNKHESRYIMTAGWVKGNTHVTINGGHILTNVYGGCEATNVDGTATVTMTSGTVGVPRTLEQIVNHPLTCYLFGAGKGDQRVFYNKSTNVKDVVVSITGGRIYGSVFGGGEDGHVLRDVTMTIGQQTTTGEGKEAVTTTSGPTIGTWGTSYVDGNVFGGGRGFGGDAYTAGNVAGSVKMEIKGGTILGSIYGGGRLGSVGYGLFDEGVSGYGEMRKDSDTEDGFTDGTSNFFTKGRGHIDITISGGTIGNTHEYIVPNATNIAAAGIAETDISKWTTDNEWKKWKTYHHIPKTEFDTATGHLTHTKGGNVFAGGMGRFYQLDGTTPISVIDWWKLGNVKSTKLTITGGNIKSNVYGGGELGQTVGHHTTQNANFGTEITIQGSSTQIGTEVTNGEITEYTFGSVFGGGYGSLLETITVNNGTSDITSYPKFIAGLVKEDTKIDMQNGAVKASIYGGGEMASVGESTTSGETTTATGSTYVYVSGGTVGIAPIEVSEGTKRYFGGAKMGNVYGGGSGHNNTVRSGRIFKNSNVIISGGMIYHNVYGGGAYGTVGDFNYKEAEDPETQTQKVFGVNSLNTADTGVATVTITGGTIGSDGNENGMVFGSSRGDIAEPGKRDDHAAWVYDANVIIGTAATPASGPDIKGSVYGSGENGHTFNNTVVMINGGTIGIADKSDPGYTIISSGTTYEGAAYPYRGNVYGGGCGTDKYYSDATGVANPRDGNGDTYNPLSGIVYGNTNVSITGGLVVRNVYGAGAMGSVGKFEKNTTTNAITFSSGGTTNINVRGGTIGGDGSAGDGNVYGAARGDKDFTDRIYALVKETNVTISGTTEGTRIMGNVYGGGEVGNVHANTAVTVEGGAIAKNVFGGGKGVDNLFTCEQAMVGVEGEGAGAKLDVEANKNKGTIVTISNGTVGTLNSGTLVEGTGNVYGGGEIGRVEWNTQVMIGTATGASTPVIYGNVFGAGKGLETHGYSALVRGNSTVTVQGDAKVGYNVYGGGENSTVGRYWVKGINNSVDGAPAAPADLPDGMPYKQQSGGICRVAIQGNAIIGSLGIDDKGHVFGAGKGVEPHFVEGTSNRMVNNNYGGSLVVFTNDGGKTAEQLYLEFLQTLSLVTNSYVTIDGSAKVKGSVFGGSESGFVQHDANVTIQGSCEIGTDKYGNIFGGGKGLEYFAEAGKVKGNTKVTISSGTVKGNVYGGGRLGDVGTIDKTNKNKKGELTYNYFWKQNDGTTANVGGTNAMTSTNNNTGVCTVTITGGTIGLESTNEPTKHGNVFGAGRGLDDTFWCEKAIAYSTAVGITGGTVFGNVYGGGQIGRVEDDAMVTIGGASAEARADIKGNVFGAGAGKDTHGYSALVRGDTKVTVEGYALVGHSVYGGGETASVGRYGLNAQKMPNILVGGGNCDVNIQGNAAIGADVFGAGKGIDPVFDSSNKPQRMTAVNGESTWETFNDADSYFGFLETLALATHPDVTISGDATISGSVYGGGEQGLTKGSVTVNILGGTIEKDVYGGGALANTNTTDKVANNYPTVAPDTDEGGNILTKTVDPTTTVNLTGGTINRNVYGGGLGQLAKDAVAAVLYTTEDAEVTEGTKKVGDVKTPAQPAVEAIAAKVYGDVLVELNKPTSTTTGEGESATTTTTYGNCEVKGTIFGCNNLNGSPQKDVTVHVYKTVTKDNDGTENDKPDKNENTYELTAVYGGGNLAAFYPDDETWRAKAKTNVIIDGCELTSIETVYGGGNAASVPATDVVINGTYEIGQAFGGGNGLDKITVNGVEQDNPGANVGYLAYTSESEKTDKAYGSGVAEITVYGGTVHAVFGGSNTLGNVRKESICRLNGEREEGSDDYCEFNVDDAYGGGRNADQDGTATLIMDCIAGLGEAYGGAENADVEDINLNIINGTYGRVFGGNNLGGRVNGSITVNIEETGCRPVIIGELYGGGNKAPYSIYGYKNTGTEDAPKWVALKKDDEGAETPHAQPRVNVKSFTSIGNIFGGGYGEEAVMVADPQIYIDVVKGKYANTVIGKDARVIGSSKKEPGDAGYDTDTGYPIPSHKSNTIGAIQNVFGGGNQAEVIGTPHVMVGTQEYVEIVTASGNVTGYYTLEGSTYTKITEDDAKAQKGTVYYQKVLGVDIRGNVYGGGNNAEVTGDTKVVIGKKANNN